MYAYYINRGHKLEDLLNLSFVEKIFYSEAMEYEIKRETEKYNALFGGGK